MATTDVVYVNGRDIDDLGLVVLEYGDRWAGPSYDRGAAQPFGSLGSWPASEATVAPKVIRLQTALEGVTRANRQASIDNIRNHFRGLLEVKFGDSEDRVIYGIVEASPGSGRWTGLGEIKADVALEFNIVCYNPLFWDTTGSIIAFGSTRVEVPVGSAPSGGIIYLMGAATNPTITYRNHDGDSVETMGFTVTLGATEYLEINLDTLSIVKVSSGTRTDGDALLTSGWFFSVDPADGDVENTSYPTLEVDQGSATINYWKTYE
jgi:hypothetical protein